MIIWLLLTGLGCADKKMVTQDFTIPIATTDTIPVTYQTAHYQSLYYPVKAIGKIRSTERSNLFFEQSGVIEKIRFSNGQTVQKGEVIATLKNQKILLDLKEAEISLRESLLNFEHEFLAVGDSTSFQNWKTIKHNLRLKTGLSRNEVLLDKAKVKYQQTILKAPFTGLIEGFNVATNDYITANETFGKIYDPTSFEVYCDILEYDLKKMEIGISARIRPLSLDLSIDGEISEINPAVNDQGLSWVLINLKGIKNLYPGISAKVDIMVMQEPSIIVPLKAVVKRSDRHVVFSIKDSRAQWNFVTLGKNNGEEVQILDGLKENDQVIISNNTMLSHDSPIKPTGKIDYP